MKTFKIVSIFLVGFFVLQPLNAQVDFTTQIFDSYQNYREASISKRRIKHVDILPLIEKLKENAKFHVQRLGESIEGRSIHLISYGTGETSVYLWSQMHGDESTATMAIFDILNFLASSEFEDEKDLLRENLSIHFLPMLNPDGAEVFERRNALGVDVNRDALRLQSPESRILKRIRDSLDADFGFNLHDQSKYYNAERTEKPATISFLAPAYNYEKSINKVRANAMKLIVAMNRVLQKYVPGQVGRYNDDFEPRAFGDNIQKWGTSTILIESGGYLNDPEKQEIRKLNYVAILSALKAIASNSFENEQVKDYETIPNNDRMLFDLKLTGIHYELNENIYMLDLGIQQMENDIKENSEFYYIGRIVDQGDLSTSYAYTMKDLTGYKLKPGLIYPDSFSTMDSIKGLDFLTLLKGGYGFLKLEKMPENVDFSPFPLNLVPENFKVPNIVKPGMNATFFLEKNGELKYAIINGFLVDLKEDSVKVKNALIFQ